MRRRANNKPLPDAIGSISGMSLIRCQPTVVRSCSKPHAHARRPAARPSNSPFRADRRRARNQRGLQMREQNTGRQPPAGDASRPYRQARISASRRPGGDATCACSLSPAAGRPAPAPALSSTEFQHGGSRAADAHPGHSQRGVSAPQRILAPHPWPAGWQPNLRRDFFAAAAMRSPCRFPFPG